MSDDFDNVDFPPEPSRPFESLPPNQIRFRFMRIGLFVIAGAILMVLLFSIASLADRSALYSIGTLIFGLIAIGLQVMFILSIWWFKWFDFVITSEPITQE